MKNKMHAKNATNVMNGNNRVDNTHSDTKKEVVSTNDLSSG